MDGRARTQQLKGLIPGARYEVTVVSVRGFEESEPLTDVLITGEMDRIQAGQRGKCGPGWELRVNGKGKWGLDASCSCRRGPAEFRKRRSGVSSKPLLFPQFLMAPHSCVH